MVYSFKSIMGSNSERGRSWVEHKVTVFLCACFQGSGHVFKLLLDQSVFTQRQQNNIYTRHKVDMTQVDMPLLGMDR